MLNFLFFNKLNILLQVSGKTELRITMFWDLFKYGIIVLKSSTNCFVFGFKYSSTGVPIVIITFLASLIELILSDNFSFFLIKFFFYNFSAPYSVKGILPFLIVSNAFLSIS